MFDTPFTLTVAPYDVPEAPFSSIGTPCNMTEAPYSVTESPYIVTESPYIVTHSPYSVTESPYSVSASPYDAKERANTATVSTDKDFIYPKAIINRRIFRFLLTLMSYQLPLASASGQNEQNEQRL